MTTWTLAIGLLLIANSVFAAGPTCHECSDSDSEALCLAHGKTSQCRSSQVCQTVVRCLANGVMVKKGCIGSKTATDINGGPTCTDSTNTKCMTYCDSDGCNGDDVDQINTVLSCAVKDVGPKCRSCDASADESTCDGQGQLVQCKDYQVCRTKMRCTSGGASEISKGCVGEGPAVNVVTCDSSDNKKCSMVCDSDGCNDDTASLIEATLSCAKPVISCRSCTDAPDEATCDQGPLEQCNPKQVCQTSIRCQSGGTSVMKKGCVGSSVAPALDQADCENGDTSKCAYYCDSEGCNDNTAQYIDTVIDCPQQPPGIKCRSCKDAPDEATCDQGPLEQCNPSQVCRTSIRCKSGGTSLIKKGCVGSSVAPALDKADCENGDTSKCAYYCDSEGCNDNTAQYIDTVIDCPQKPPGIKCRSCIDALDEATCDQGPLEQCNPNQVCQTSIRCQSGGSSLMKKGCVGSSVATALDTPYCENGDTSKCAYYCDSEGCNDNTAQNLDTVIDCPTTGVGPICTVCDNADNEGDCNTQGIETCTRNQICFAKVLCDRPNETARYKKKCLNIAAVADLSSLNKMVCENIDNCSLACDTDNCNTDTAELFQSLNCPVKPPGIDCQTCTDVDNDSDCADVRCRDGNLCYTKVTCQRDSGLTTITKRCKRESVADPAMLDNPVCIKDFKCAMTCGQDGCNADSQTAIAALGCTIGPPVNVTDPPEATTPNVDILIPQTTSAPGQQTTLTPNGTVDACTKVQGTGTCECRCTCNTTCLLPVPPPPTVLPCTIGVTAPDAVNTCDGASVTLDPGQKYIATRWRHTSDDQCKFQVRAVTEAAPDGAASLAWTSIFFGVDTTKSQHFERNYRIAKTPDVIEIRGSGYNPTILTQSGCHHSDHGVHPWTFCVNMDTPGTYIVRGEVPELQCWFETTFTEADTPQGNSMLWVESSPSYDGQLEGICGNRDGDAGNDDIV